MIWDNILRLENLRDVHRLMHFNYILPKEISINQVSSVQSFAVWIVVDSADNMLWYTDYIDEFSDADIYIVGTETIIESLKDNIQNKKVTYISSSREEIYFTILLSVYKYSAKYEYMCVLNMHKWDEELRYGIDISAEYQAWENLVGSRIYIQNLINTFNENPRLGMLIPPSPVHGKWFEKMEDGWMGYFNIVSDMLKNMNISVNVKKSSEPLFPVAGCFWIRTKLLDRFKDLAIDKIYDRNSLFIFIPLFLQSQHYYTGVVYTEEYAAIETTNQDYMLRENNKVIFEKYGAGYFHEVLNKIKNS